MTNGEMGILMDFGLDKRAASTTLWTNITKQGCSMTLERQSSTFDEQDFFNALYVNWSISAKFVDIGIWRFLRSLEELPDQPYE